MTKRIGFGLAVVALATMALAADSGPRLNAREIQVPGSAMLVQLWDQANDQGTQAYWSVAFDGRHYSEPRATSYQILFEYANFDPATDSPAVPALLAADADTHVYVVQYYTQPFEQYRAQISALGGLVHFFVPQNADLVTLPEGTLPAVQALPFVRAVTPFQPAYRVDPTILTTLRLDGPAERYSVECLDRGATQQEAVAALVNAAGGTVHFIQPNDFRMEVTCSPTTLLLIARNDGVNRVEPWPGPGGFDMDHARGPEGHDANYVEAALGLTGQGCRGEVFDTEHQRPTHQEFQAPPTLIHGTNGNSGTHGTYTFSEVFARGVNSQARGMLPSREQGIFCWYAQTTQFGGTLPRSEETRQCVDPNGPYRCLIQTSSVGSSLVTTYTTISAEVDDYLFLYDLLSCQSQSNNGNQSSRPQAWAKNIVSVGGFYHNNNASRADDRWNSGASTGPASDGRIKPDLAAYYDSTYTATPTSDTSYWDGMNGTSGATPMTAGAIGMLFHMWHAGVWAGHGGAATPFESRCHMATAKALAINTAYMYKVSASDSGQPGTPAFTDQTRYHQGWGQANLRNALDQAPLTLVVDETDLLTPLASKSYTINVATGQPTFKATLVYTDPKGNPNVQSQHRVNNLDLKVTAPGGTIYWGNNNMANSSWTSSGGSADTKNTVENVFIQNPAAGAWKVEVIGTEIVQDSHPETPALDADYALVVYGGRTGLKGDMDCSGVVDFDDINPFVLALSDPGGYAIAYPNCNIMNGDCNGDGVFNFDDINPFVAILSGPP